MWNNRWFNSTPFWDSGKIFGVQRRGFRSRLCPYLVPSLWEVLLLFPPVLTPPCLSHSPHIMGSDHPLPWVWWQFLGCWVSNCSPKLRPCSWVPNWTPDLDVYSMCPKQNSPSFLPGLLLCWGSCLPISSTTRIPFLTLTCSHLSPLPHIRPYILSTLFFKQLLFLLIATLVQAFIISCLYCCSSN